jgi:DNA-binding transcriptional LysR family regulator
MKNADIKQLALLCELIDTQSLTEAALRMSITPSAANQSLNRLHIALGETLFVRQGQDYLLTPFGEAAHERFRHLVDLWRQATDVGAKFDPRSATERLSIAFSEAEIIVDPVALYADVSQEAPSITFDLHAAQNSLVDIVNLRSAQVDLVCTHMAPPVDAGDLHSVRLGAWRATVCCFRVDHPRLASTADLSLDQYLAEVHLVTMYTSRRELQESPVAKMLERLGRQRRVSLAASVSLVAQIVSRTDRIVTCSRAWASQLQRLTNNVRYLPLPPEIVYPEADLFLVWHQRTHHSPPHRWLRDRIKVMVNAAGKVTTT